MRAWRAVLILSLLAATIGCSGGGGSNDVLNPGGGGVCTKSTTDSIYVSHTWGTFTVTTITLTNAGSQSFSGHVSFTGSSVPSGLTFSLPANVNPDFTLALGGSITYTIILGPGQPFDAYHQCHGETMDGTVDLGSVCGTVRIQAYLAQWDEPAHC